VECLSRSAPNPVRMTRRMTSNRPDDRIHGHPGDRSSIFCHFALHPPRKLNSAAPNAGIFDWSSHPADTSWKQRVGVGGPEREQWMHNHKISHTDMENDHIDAVLSHIIRSYPISISRMTLSIW